MYSSLIGKVEKANRYTEERDRFSFTAFTVRVRGDNNEHEVSFKDGEWHCDCDFFTIYGLCSHGMALERILDEMVSAKMTFSDMIKAKTGSALP
jgi:hypothetical protein